MRPLEQAQEKCEAVSRPELRKNNGLVHFRDSKKTAMLQGDKGIE